MDLYHLCEEAAPIDRTALETVVDYIKDEVARLTVSLYRLVLKTSMPDETATQT